jgi:hypothetical protein
MSLWVITLYRASWGALDTGLNALPYVGAVKLGAESLRGRDFIEDRGAAPRR